MTETVSQALVCKSNAAEFLKERAILNDAAATTWCQDYIGMPWLTSYGLCVWSWTRLTYVGGCEFVGEYIIVSSDIYKKITDTIKTVWKDIKKEDETENDTITALILGLVRLESLGEVENNYLNIHEIFVSPERYDIETKRSARLLILGKGCKPKLEIIIDNPDYNPTTSYSQHTLISTCYILPTRPRGWG